MSETRSGAAAAALDLSETLRAHLTPELAREAEALGEELDAELARLLGRAAQASALAAAAPAELLAHVAQRLPAPLLTSLQQLRVEDLTLAWACARADRSAMEQVERRHFDVIDLALRQLPDAAAQVSEIKQQLRDRLFVGAEGGSPRIAQYAGRGDLRSWLRVAAVRCAMDLFRSRRREVTLPDQMLDNLPASPDDQELAHLKRKYQEDFKAAFEAALLELTARERNILRYSYIEGLNIEQIGAIHGVHRATVARWLTRIREDLLKRTRKQLMERLQVGRTELESIMRLIQSQLDASIERLL